MSRLYRVHCRLFNCLLLFQSDDLIAHYGDEIRSVFRDELSRAWHKGAYAIFRVWSEVISEAIVLTAPRYFVRAQAVLTATTLATALAIGSALGFCTIGDSSIVRACAQEQSGAQSS